MKRIMWGIAVSVLVAGSADAALLSRAGGDAYYDDVLDITWLADANYAYTSGYDSNGDMTWNEAQTWLGSLNTANHLGASNWRLPETLQPDASCSHDFEPVNGIQNVAVSWGYGCTGSEMGHLFNVDGISDSAPSPFSNVGAYYWSATAYAFDPGYVWSFAFDAGFQGPDIKGAESSSWAVRPGDIDAVPAPGALWLFGTGVAALGAKLKRRARGDGTAA